MRALSGAAYVAITLAALYAGSFTTALLFLPVCLIVADEFHRLHWIGPDHATAPPRYWTVLLAGAFFIAVAFVQRFGVPALHWLGAWTMLLLLISLAWSLFIGPGEVVGTLAGALMTMLYIALPFALLPHFFSFGSNSDGLEAAMGLFLLLWTNDTGAYICGRAFGRTKLLPSVSPKKTIEGMAGGVLLTIGVAWLLSKAWPVLTAGEWISGAVVISFAGTIGDLLESAMKRAAGVKDSGAIMPGHGGLLDRFDGFLLATPAFYALLALLR